MFHVSFNDLLIVQKRVCPDTNVNLIVISNSEFEIWTSFGGNFELRVDATFLEGSNGSHWFEKIRHNLDLISGYQKFHANFSKILTKFN